MLATADFAPPPLPLNVTQTLGLLGNVLVMGVVLESRALWRGFDFTAFLG